MAVTRQTSRKTLILQPTNAEVSTNQVYAPRYEFLVDGELTLPVPRIINSLKHTDAAASIYRVDVSVNKGGTSQYNIQIISYNQLGVDPVIHVDQTITLDTDRLRTTIPVTDAAVGENRSLECVVTEVNANVPATDMTVTIIMEDFAAIQVLRNGHRILDGDGIVQPQKDDLQFIHATVTEDIVNQRTVVNTHGHVVEDATGTDLPQQPNLQVINGTLTDDPINDRTILNTHGHVIQTDGGFPVAQRESLRFVNGTVTDDAVNNRTIVNTNGHRIINPAGTALTQRADMQFTGPITVSDNAGLGRTVINVAPRVAVLRDRRTRNTAVPSTTSFSGRVFNTLEDPTGIVINPGSFVGINGTNTSINLSPGTYLFDISPFVFSGRFTRSRLVNLNTGAIVAYSNHASANEIDGTYTDDTHPVRLTTIVTISEATTFRVDSYTQFVVPNGFGQPHFPAGGSDEEVYSQMIITKLI